MKKGFDGWRIVHPLKNEDGSLNWNNIILGGSVWSFVKILLVFLLLIGTIIVYHYDTKKCTETLTHIDDICAALAQSKTVTYNHSVDASILNNALLKLNNSYEETETG